MTPTEAWRRRVTRNDQLFKLLSFAATIVGLIVLAALVIDVLRTGLPRLDWQFLTSFPSRKPENAGIYSALVGSVWLLVPTAIVAFPSGARGGVSLVVHTRPG